MGVTVSKVLHRDLNAEAAVLGAILLRNESMALVADVLAPEHFSRHAHALIFRAMVALWKRRKPIDLVLLCDELGDEGLAEARLPYITTLIDGVPRTANAGHYAHIVRDLAERRALAAALVEASKAVADPGATLSEAATYAARAIQPALPKPKLVTPDAYASNFRAWWRDDTGRAIRRVNCGISPLDARMRGGFPVGLTVIGGRPSHGKTALALSIAHNIGFGDEGMDVLFCSGEMNEQQITGRLVALHGRLHAESIIAGDVEAVDADDLDAAIDSVEKQSKIVFDFRKLTPSMLRATAMNMKATRGLGAIVLDYIQLMPSEPAWVKQGMKRYEQIGKMVDEYKQTGLELGVPVLALSQLSRGATTRKEPTNEDLRESGDIEQHADMIWLLHRPPGEHTGTVIISKQRNGSVGRADVFFHQEWMRYMDADSRDEHGRREEYYS